MIINPAQQVHGREEIDAINRVAESGHWAEGEASKTFRKDLGEYLGVRYVTLTNSGSSANLAALMALTTEWVPEDRRIMPNDHVITPALCFPTTVSPIVRAGAYPAFVDIEPGTWNINPQQVEDMIIDKTKAIMVAHNLGNPFNLDVIKEICNRHNLWLIEDNCDSLGSEWDGKKTGTHGHIGTSSFYPAHHISCGEGGAVYTNNSKIYMAIKSMVNWGRHCWCEPGYDDTCGKRYEWELGKLPHGYDHKNTYSEMGYNLKMTDLQASIGIEQLKRIDGFKEKRQGNHAFLRRFFKHYEEFFELPEWYSNADPSWFGYVIKLREGVPFTRDQMVRFLDSAGIRSRAFFSGNILKHPAFANGKFPYWKHKDLSVSDDMMNNSFWIGVHPAIGFDERNYMHEVIANFLSQNI